MAAPRAANNLVRCPLFLPSGARVGWSTVWHAENAVGWPSGLRRQFQALVSSEAWVRIPLQSVFDFVTLRVFFWSPWLCV